ncbi:hypothetical protein Vadar_010951 [Vaccinium darrowii]|uniref:Uncharacterized protein n=1 Tax=Vaccinium darrowii TaxID=229202 RepID=A0ACB7Y5W5_9ERIC|nr:hypothetical protein Vadar_010951 [Vaccinium darrowii]
MLAQSPETATHPTGNTSENLTTEEEDHLVRSTKKVKNDHDYSANMVEDTTTADPPHIQDTIMCNSEVNQRSHNSVSPEMDTTLPPPKPLSFKQVQIASRGKEIPFSDDVESLPLDEDFTEEEENFDEEEEVDGVPVVKLPQSLLAYSRQPWKNAVIVKPIGYPIGYKSLCTKIKSVWDLQGDFSALEIGLGFVVFKFDMASDRTHVLTAGPWIINDQYITVREWEPRFKPDEAEEIQTAVWIRFPNFPLEYYYEKNIFRIARRLGRPIRADSTTVETDRGRYARVCVEIDLSKPVKSRVLIEGKIYRVEYEHIPIMCFGCGRVGHRRDQCTWSNKPNPSPGDDAPQPPVTASGATAEETTTINAVAQTPVYGHWTLVQRKPRRPNTGKRFTDRPHLAQNSKNPGLNSQKSDGRNNRFSLLNWFDASTSNSKRPNPSNKASVETKNSQSVWTKVKNGHGPKNQALDKSSPYSANPSFTSTPNPSANSNLHIPDPIICDPKLSSPLNHITTSQSASPLPSPQPSLHLVPDGNRDIPPPSSSDLHPDQTRGRRRSDSESRMVDVESKDGGDGSRVQRSRSPILRSGSGESEGNSTRPAGSHEDGRME